MKLEFEKDFIKTNLPIDSTHRFTIKHSAKMFRVLSATLYSNKVAAIIRELACNAYDSHIAAKQQLPFIIRLPNYLDPTFSVIDYGLGLSHEDIYKIFTVYGESTKSDSNDFTGALGLGAKSPFAYLDTYNIISNFNGKKSIYTAFKSADGTPSILHVNTEDTTDCNGLEISFPVLESDFYAFVLECGKILSHFPQGSFDVQGEKITVVDPFVPFIENKDDGWRIINSHGVKQSYVVQGNVCYPIDVRSMRNISNIASTMLTNFPIVFYVPIGTVDFQPSREHLSYDEVTMSRIEALAVKVYNFILNEITVKLDSCANEWEALLAYKTLNLVKSVAIKNQDDNIISIYRHFLKTFAPKIQTKFKEFTPDTLTYHISFIDVQDVCDVYYVHSSSSWTRKIKKLTDISYLAKTHLCSYRCSFTSEDDRSPVRFESTYDKTTGDRRDELVSFRVVKGGLDKIFNVQHSETHLITSPSTLNIAKLFKMTLQTTKFANSFSRDSDYFILVAKKGKTVQDVDNRLRMIIPKFAPIVSNGFKESIEILKQERKEIAAKQRSANVNVYVSSSSGVTTSSIPTLSKKVTEVKDSAIVVLKKSQTINQYLQSTAEGKKLCNLFFQFNTIFSSVRSKLHYKTSNTSLLSSPMQYLPCIIFMSHTAHETLKRQKGLHNCTEDLEKYFKDLFVKHYADKTTVDPKITEIIYDAYLYFRFTQIQQTANVSSFFSSSSYRTFRSKCLEKKLLDSNHPILQFEKIANTHYSIAQNYSEVYLQNCFKVIMSYFPDIFDLSLNVTDDLEKLTNALNVVDKYSILNLLDRNLKMSESVINDIINYIQLIDMKKED